MKKRTSLQPGQGIYIAATIAMIVFFLAAAGLGMLSEKTGITISYPCLFKELFHLYCPGCGGTRAVKELLHFHIIKSFLYHPLVPYLAFLFLYYYIGTTLAVLCKGQRIFFRPRMWMLVWAVVLFFANVIIRNGLAVFCGIDYIGDIVNYWQ